MMSLFKLLALGIHGKAQMALQVGVLFSMPVLQTS